MGCVLIKPTQMKCTSIANNTSYITLFYIFFYQNLINLGYVLLIIKIFSQYSIITSDKKMIEDSLTQNVFPKDRNENEKCSEGH